MNTDFDIRELSRVDAPRMCEMFRETVLHVNSQDYTREEVEDWASCGDSVEHMEELLSNNRYVGAFDKQNHIIGFSSMNASGYLHSMFVHKEWQKKGIASALLMQVERYAKEYGVSEISAEVSITARPFFEKRGYRVIKVQKQRANKLHLTNYWMKKQIPANG
ncbi:MAG TPA: GNAT family N-acetyltransferase [Candidatus Gallibacteroides avistercoris]|uniref:GNAT family N-acetyltransferase n=1 Tax=Candidatus Gallibacteroides avistercoris TaxID=2840833 RepID=A0A9D1M6Q8_9BACT|nr:GNAT family N-acetyltransferase [Candidatus Gallibacteroides avistercoris]